MSRGERQRRSIDGPWGVLQVELERRAGEVLELTSGPPQKGESRKALAARENAHRAAHAASLYLAKGETLIALDHLAVAGGWVGVGILSDKEWAEQVDRAEKGEAVGPLRSALRTAWAELEEVAAPCAVHLEGEEDPECISCAVVRAVTRKAREHQARLTGRPRTEWGLCVKRARQAAAALGAGR